uniref:Peptidase S1 domain-containing protein n=1 Tax=Maylandia zebra TaxID=106582 RepID=A0A3P9D6Y0_9CICH
MPNLTETVHGGYSELLLGVTANTEVALQKRVIGGDECERQYHVQLRAVYPHGPSSLCGGSLISDRWILQLTMRSCFIVQASGQHFKVNVQNNQYMYLYVTDKKKERKASKHFLCHSRVEVAGYAELIVPLFLEPGESPSLHCAETEVVSCTDYQHWFCGQSPGKDICRGDSGGGVVHNGRIYGVSSFVGDPDFVCRAPAAFMDLCDPEYADWIRKTINP